RKKARKEAPAEASEEAAAEASEEAAAEASEELTTTVGKGLGRALRRSSICRKGWKLWSRRLVSPQNGNGHHLKTLPLHLNRRSNPGQSLKNKN
ncbi:BnaCnng56760D, partial [Brassica napus]